MLAYHEPKRQSSSLPVNSGLNENETELGVLVLAVALKVLSDGNSLADRLAGYFGSRNFIMTCVPS